MRNLLQLQLGIAHLVAFEDPSQHCEEDEFF